MARGEDPCPCQWPDRLNGPLDQAASLAPHVCSINAVSFTLHLHELFVVKRKSVDLIYLCYIPYEFLVPSASVIDGSTDADMFH